MKFVSRSLKCFQNDSFPKAILADQKRGATKGGKGFKNDGDPGYDFDHEVLIKLRQRATRNLPRCRGCFAKWHCAGDCHYKALMMNGGEDHCGSERCRIVQALTRDQILERIDSSGGVYWHESRDLMQNS